MKKKLMLLAVFALLSVAPATAATGDFWIGFHGGISSPTGDFGDVADMGFQGAVSGTYMIASQFGIGADLGFHMWNGSDEFNEATQFLLADPSAEWKFSAIQATAHAMYAFPTGGKAMPYLKGGLGLYNFKAKLETDTDEADESESNFGFNVGGGVNFLASPMYTIGVGAAYHSIQTEDESTDLFTVGINLMWGMSGGQ